MNDTFGLSIVDNVFTFRSVLVLFSPEAASMLIKIKHLMDGPGPSEAIVGVRDAVGRLEEVVVDTSLIATGLLDVGPIVTRKEGQVLIELPREAASGRVRIWVPEAEMAKEPQPA